MGGSDEFGRPFDHGHDYAGGFDILIAQTELADGFHATDLEILGIVPVIDDIHLVGLGVADADIGFTGEHRFTVANYLPMALSTLNRPGPVSSKAKKATR